MPEYINNNTKLVILAAGIGSRINMGIPKGMIALVNGQTILERQIKIAMEFIKKENIIIIAGYKHKMISIKFPDITLVINKSYKKTNTAKSLQLALDSIKPETTIWVNGDVVYDRSVFSYVVKSEQSCMAVNEYKTSDEEIKYSTSNNKIKKVSKTISNAEGEAVGINKINKNDYLLLLNSLKKCNDNDYFEKGIEIAIENGLNIYPSRIGESFAIEVDFIEDLEKVNYYLSSNDV